MTFSPDFKKSFVISLISHFTLFSIFTFSFGAAIPRSNKPAVYFWGQLLRSSEFVNFPLSRANTKLVKEPKAGLLKGISKGSAAPLLSHLKPLAPTLFARNETAFIPGLTHSFNNSKKIQPVVMLHPLLPYYFMFLFKDRQVAHIELEFKISQTQHKRFIFLKRKIASGNLEADLLTMRYIGHYLFIQNRALTVNEWQTIKIDLSANANKPFSHD